MTNKSSFAPIIDPHAQVLILGSLPGDLSIAKNEYYAHPQNRFWKILFQLFEVENSTNYQDRIDLLKANRIALWDVCETAWRKGSMDTDIHEVTANKIHELLSAYPNIKKIVFNGKKAMQLYDKHFNRLAHITYIYNPSSSPANATFSMEKLLNSWKNLTF